MVALDDFNPYYSPALKRARASQLTSAYGSRVRVVRGDLCDGRLLRRLFREHRPTHVVNLAAQAGVRYSLQQPQTYARANVRCFVELLEALREWPRVVLTYASSSSVYGANKEAPFSELQRVDSPNSLYAATKKVRTPARPPLAARLNPPATPPHRAMRPSPTCTTISTTSP